eukprot:TRINITY_DN82271_c0_g1_i1.p2 TRINITY_DN82271_c0_g1~~TRINITY_DN82271_c0_g1_i1.p2  ORF type:complete len:493 (+),score=138.33 TRINITY_DN82271_c0_g1_i1:124-1602(+)
MTVEAESLGDVADEFAELAADETLFEDVEVQEDLKDSVEGSLRLKRLLTRDQDEDDGPLAKKAKGETTKETKIRGCLTKWRHPNDLILKHVLDSIPEEELDAFIKTGYSPDFNNQWKSASDLLTKYICEQRERKVPGAGRFDIIMAFRTRWSLDKAAEDKLRQLSHKDLRYVVDNFNSTSELDDMIAEAASFEADDETTETSLPAAPGVQTMARFARLELIDPLADSAVFGDANLTFALRLAKHRQALGHVGRVIATTFEELDTLRERYKEIDESIATLEERYAEVYHGVDCTRIAIDSRFDGMQGTLGAVYYNYPHSGAIQGFFDGHPMVNWRHENLMRLFFRALRSFMKPGGVVKVASNMGAVGVRYSYIISPAVENEFIHTETMPFLEWHLHRYGRSYGDRRDAYKRPDEKKNQSYNAQNGERDMVYCFKYAPTGETLGKQMIRLPPTLKTLCACADGPFKHLVGAAKENLAKQLHNRFATELSGTHVG